MGIPWYIYAAGLSAIALGAKTIGNVAMTAIAELEKEEAIEENNKSK